MATSRLTVLVSAYACEPDRGSEPGVGWNLVKTMSSYHTVHVITRKNNEGIISHQKKVENLSIVFHYYDLSDFWLRMKRRGKLFGYVYYMGWQVGVYWFARRILKSNAFDVVHHVTYGNIWMPTFMGFLGLPFVLGPVGGCEKVPNLFRQDFTVREKLKELVHDAVVSSLAYNPLFLYNCYRANRIIAKTTDTANRIPRRYQYKCSVLTDVGINAADIYQIPATDNTFTLLNVGTFESWRGQLLLVRAFASAVKKASDIKLILVGYGENDDRLRSWCRKMGILESVEFLGKINYHQYIAYLKKSTIIATPTLKEGSVTFFMDAVGYGKPIINLDVPGCAQLNKIIGGFCIELGSIEQVEQDLCQAILELYNSPELRTKLSLNACRAASEFCTWESKAKIFNQIYNEAHQCSTEVG